MQPQKLEAGKVYSMFTASGRPEEIKQKPALPMYCKVYCFGYGMSETPAAVISEPDQHGQQKAVYMSEYCEHGFTTVDKHSRPLSKKFGIGHYYSDNFETYPEQEVKEVILKAEQAVIERAEAAKQKAAADKKEMEELPTIYPHLTPVKQHAKGYFAACKDNLRADLKKNFPGFKFSVSSSHYSTINIKWTDGPTVEEVEKITGKYTDHETDISGDYRDPAASNFNNIFGGANYIFENRDTSAEVEAFKAILDELRPTPADRWENGQIFHRMLSKTSLLNGKKITGISRTDITCGSIEDFFQFTFEEPAATAQAPTPAKQPAAEPQTGDIEILEYSTLSFVVRGEGTRAIKDTLMLKGGAFNRHLKCGPGFVFSKKKYHTINTYLKSLQVK